jgi:hypothetical protein
VAGRSLVKIAVDNPGNVRLKPAVEFVLRDATRTELSRTTLQMDTFYAWTDTFVAVSLASLLPAGNYTVELTVLDDLQGVRAGATLNLVVGAPPAIGSGGGEGPGLTPVGPGGADQSMALLLAGLALILAALGLGAFAFARNRRQRRP